MDTGSCEGISLMIPTSHTPATATVRVACSGVWHWIHLRLDGRLHFAGHGRTELRLAALLDAHVPCAHILTKVRQRKWDDLPGPLRRSLGAAANGRWRTTEEWDQGMPRRHLRLGAIQRRYHELIQHAARLGLRLEPALSCPPRRDNDDRLFVFEDVGLGDGSSRSLASWHRGGWVIDWPKVAEAGAEVMHTRWASLPNEFWGTPGRCRVCRVRPGRGKMLEHAHSHAHLQAVTLALEKIFGQKENEVTDEHIVSPE
jgi:hypothetical protein